MEINNQNLIEVIGNDSTFEMILVEGGTFMMGSEEVEDGYNEYPIHEVHLQDFYIGQYSVTQEVWKLVMKTNDNPSRYKGNDRPVEQVSWNDTRDFIDKLNRMTSRDYRLLSEAEWEYAARGGSLSQGYIYSGSNQLEEVSWYSGNSNGESRAVGLKKPNELGLYDMSGNIWDWVEDQWHRSYKGAPGDGSAWVDTKENYSRIIRGGSWQNRARYCRTSCRIGSTSSTVYNDVIGFRLALSSI